MWTGANAQNIVKNRFVEGSTSYRTHEAALRFAREVAERRGLDPKWVRQVLAQAEFQPNVQRLMLPPPPGKPKDWSAYRSRFIDPVRIRAGVRFWEANREALAQAEEEFGVPARIIVGIIGVETIYGQNMGNYRVLDALATLTFDFPQEHPRAAARQAYFQGELESFLTLAARSGFDPLKRLGSYAGAMGMPQFMPSSQAKYAIDFDRDGAIDLYQSAADVIGSVANYFKGYGWRNGVPPFYPVLLAGKHLDLAALLEPDILPTFSVQEFTENGAILWGDAVRYSGKLALVELQNGDAPPQYVAGTENFYVITRYNASSYYAMAVIELGREIEAALGP
ncbi:MAG: lytic murein transglycosylase B [Burkholderiales bacterium]